MEVFAFRCYWSSQSCKILQKINLVLRVSGVSICLNNSRILYCARWLIVEGQTTPHKFLTFNACWHFECSWPIHAYRYSIYTLLINMQSRRKKLELSTSATNVCPSGTALMCCSFSNMKRLFQEDIFNKHVFKNIREWYCHASWSWIPLRSICPKEKHSAAWDIQKKTLIDSVFWVM